MLTNPYMIKTLSSSQQFTLVWKLSPWPQLSLTPAPARTLSHKWPSQLGVSNSLFFQTSCFLKHLSHLPRIFQSQAPYCKSHSTLAGEAQTSCQPRASSGSEARPHDISLLAAVPTRAQEALHRIPLCALKEKKQPLYFYDMMRTHARPSVFLCTILRAEK